MSSSDWNSDDPDEKPERSTEGYDRLPTVDKLIPEDIFHDPEEAEPEAA